jgi:D-alanyl-D-alanine carboxypeptidase
VRLQGSETLSFADQYARMMATTAVQGLPAAKPETLNELMDVSLNNLVYHEGDESALAYGEAPGAVVLVQSPTGSMAKADGLSSVEEGKPMGANDRLEIGSNTMMFTAVLLAQLTEEGVVSLDDPLSTWLPQMAMVIPYGDEITLRHLATHTSGVPDYAELVIDAGATDSEALRSGYTPEELVAIAVESFEPEFTPGEEGQWQFSNTNYILLGMVLEAATGSSYADLLQQRIFGPLEMDRTELLEGVPYPDSIVDGYYAFPYDVNTTEWNGSQGWAAGGIISSAPDMAKFARALMDGELFIDPATLDLMTDFFAGGESGGDTGYGLGLTEFAPGLFGHRGQTVGFTSFVAMDPANDFLMIALTNSAEGAVAVDSEQ